MLKFKSSSIIISARRIEPVITIKPLFFRAHLLDLSIASENSTVLVFFKILSPIFLEIEGVIEEELYYIDSFDLYCETNLNCQKRLIDMIYLTNLFSNYVKVERNIDVSNPKKESLVISSKLQELLLNSDIEGLENLEAQLTSLESSSHNSITSVSENSEDIEFKEIFIDLNQFNLLLTEHLKFFVEFIKLLHDLLIKNKPIDKLKK